MKTPEQIKIAQEMIKDLHDYVELAKVEKKLKVAENIENVTIQLQEIINSVTEQVEKI